MTYRSPFLTRCAARGFIHQCTDDSALDAVLTRQTQPVVAYIGFDCTAPSLHVGSLMQIMMLRHFQQSGHKPIVLMGGGTTRVGDPSGKDESRQLITGEAIQTNMDGIKRAFGRFLTFEETFDAGTTHAVMVNNADWLDKLEYIPFLRDVGRHFSVNRMLSMDSVKLRLGREQHLSFLEFNYMILQSYDFVELQRRYGCRLQIGGSDQWGNIVMGVELCSRMRDDAAKDASSFGLTTPLLTTSSGAKMGKTADGAVWLDASMLSPYDYWQYWRNTEDADVGRFLKLFTDLPLEEIARLEALEGADINEAKKILATEATALCHGKEEAEKAAATAQQTFEQGNSAAGLPTIDIPENELQAGIPAFKMMQLAGLATSGGEARRLIRGGGGKINDAAFADENEPVTLAHINDDGVIKLSAGKKKHVLVKVG